MKLHYMVWQILGRVAWLFSWKSQRESISQTNARINEFIEIVEHAGYQNILVVSHGFFMKVLVHKLKKMGFRGNLDFSPQNGKLYTFERK
jgi:broad specificity phosphatase PhoE